MATALTVITDAFKEIGVLAEGDTPTASMADDALRALNRIMAMLSNDQAFAYFPNLITRNLTGESSFTIGPTGDVISDRPIKIETATVDRQGITYPVTVLITKNGTVSFIKPFKAQIQRLFGMKVLILTASSIAGLWLLVAL